MELGLEQRRLLLGEWCAHVESARTGRDAVVELQHLHQTPEGAARARVDAEVPTVAAHEGAGDETGAGRGILPHSIGSLGRQGGHRCVGLAPEHGVVGQRTVEQRRVDMPAGAVRGPAVEGGQRAEECQVGRAEAGLGQPFEDRALAVAGLLGHGAHQCMHQGFAGGDVAVRTVAAEAGDRTRDEPRIDRPQVGRARDRSAAPASRSHVSTKTSAPASSTRSWSRCGGSSRSRITLRLFRLNTDAPSGDRWRSGLPPGGSIHTTSAPYAAISPLARRPASSPSSRRRAVPRARLASLPHDRRAARPPAVP